MKKIIFLLVAALMIPSISFAAKGGSKPPPGVDLETALEETKLELCNLYDFVGAPLPLLCLDFCGDGTQESFEGCDDGNIVDGDGCSADCTIETIDCGTLSPPTNGSVSYSNSTTEGSVATYSCDSGYTLTGDDTERTCQADGTWSGSEPTCEQVPSGQQIFNSSGTFIVPQGVTLITVQLAGAGGGGGGGGNTAVLCFEGQGGGGGGAGGLSESIITVAPGSSIPVTIGNGGGGGAPGSNGQTGGNTVFGSTLLSAGGGMGGQGGADCGDSPAGSGGAGGAGNLANGTNGQNGVTCSGGIGGYNSSSGVSGGSGGDGECTASTTMSPGQSGQKGYAIISW